jgi:hypothetical protein
VFNNVAKVGRSRRQSSNGKPLASFSATETTPNSPLLWNKVFIAAWKGALTEGIEIREAQRRTEDHSAYLIASLYADLGKKIRPSSGSNTAYYERDRLMLGLKADFPLDSPRSDPRFAELCGQWGCHSSSG